MILKELIAFCDDGNTMITIEKKKKKKMENAKASMLYTSSHYQFYDVISFGVHRGELHICVSGEPNLAEKQKFYNERKWVSK